MNLALNTNAQKRKPTQGERWDDWIAELDTHGPNPSIDDIPDLLARCPDRSRPEAKLLESDLKMARK